MLGVCVSVRVVDTHQIPAYESDTIVVILTDVNSTCMRTTCILRSGPKSYPLKLDLLQILRFWVACILQLFICNNQSAGTGILFVLYLLFKHVDYYYS